MSEYMKIMTELSEKAIDNSLSFEERKLAMETMATMLSERIETLKKTDNTKFIWGWTFTIAISSIFAWEFGKFIGNKFVGE